jgi:hypothetical protein
VVFRGFLLPIIGLEARRTYSAAEDSINRLVLLFYRVRIELTRPHHHDLIHHHWEVSPEGNERHTERFSIVEDFGSAKFSMTMNVLFRAAALALEFFSRIGKCFNDSMPQATGMKKQKTQGPSLGLSL